MNLLIGYIGVLFAALGFATNFMVIKKWSPGDGMFFQLNMVVGVWIVGIFFHIALGSPPFQPFAMVGGALWATGNAMCPFIIENIGMGMGLLIWGTANMSIGWASSFFGILMINKQPVTHPEMNVIGAVVAVSSIMIYSQVKGMGAEEKAARDQKKRKLKQSSRGGINSDYSAGELESLINDAPAVGESTAASRAANRTLAFGMALAAGLLFGTCFNPPQHIVDQTKEQFCAKLNNIDNATIAEAGCKSIMRNCDYLNTVLLANKSHPATLDCDEMADWHGRLYCTWDDNKNECDGIPIQDMAFSQFCGMLVTSFFWCCAYIAYKQGYKGEEPWVNKPLIGPGFVCGAIWAIAQIGWFYANDNLPQSVSFPVVTTAPGLIATMLGIFVYDEVSLKQNNLIKLVAAIIIAAVGDALVTMSK